MVIFSNRPKYTHRSYGTSVKEGSYALNREDTLLPALTQPTRSSVLSGNSSSTEYLRVVIN